MADDVKSKIEELERELYSKDFKPHATEDILTRKEIQVASSWGESADVVKSTESDAIILKRHNTMKKFVLYSVLFFVVAAAVAGFIWWKGANVVSGENITIDISAPASVAGGEVFKTSFAITNSNKVSVDAATLLVEYPTGFYSDTDKSELLRTSKDLGIIAPGQSLSENIDAIVYGEENTSKDVAVTLEYRMAGSNATLRKTATYSIKISSSPVNLKLSAIREASSGQQVEYMVDIGSNSKDPISALAVEATYPTGFNFKSADPSPVYGNKNWQISGLAPGETRTIKISGTLEGQENEEKITKIVIGAQSKRDERYIGVVYNATTESTTMTRPFMSIDVSMDGKSSLEHVARPENGVRVDVAWKNNNQSVISDVVFEIKLKGSALNRYAIYASSGGFYRSVDDTIVWDKTRSPALSSVEPGDKGSVSFSFSPKPLGVGASSLTKNPQVTFEVIAHARGSSASNISENLNTSVSRTVKFETDLRLAIKGTYFAGPFKNTGPLPPKAEKETTYTITFIVRNSSNSVSNVVARTSLPIYVKWLNNISPEGENIIYNDINSEVVWNIGSIPSGGTREASFQISLLPSLSQLRQSPSLTGSAILEGTDDFTKTEVSDKKNGVSTNLTSDPQFGQGQADVVN